MKENGEEDCHDGAEICELVGSFILSKISPIMMELDNCGLYRSDGLSKFRNLSGPKIKRKKKK